MSDVPEGYKMSEVEVIPEGWEEERLGKECELITKGTTPTSLGKEFKDNGINFIKIESLEENGTIIKEKVAFIDEETNKLLKRSQLKENDVLVSIAGALGRIAIVKAEILPANTNQALAIVRLKPQTKLNRNYLFYFLNSARIKKHINAINVQAAQANLSLENINDFTIFIPSLPEQQAIASALSDVDALIAALEQLITKKRNIKQGAMQQLLTGEKRLPGFGGAWEVKKLEGILQSTKLGGNYPNSEKETNYPLIKMGNINRGFIDLSKIEFITTGHIPSENDKLEYGDILFNTRNTLELVGKVSIWKNELPLAYYNSNLMRLQFKKSEVYSNFFMNYILNTKQSLSQLKGFATGTTSVAAIYTRDLLKLEVPLPHLLEQQAIAQILSDMDTEIESLKQKRDKYKAIKQGMMQELLTGKTRLV